MRIYLDYNASTPLLPEVREAMLPWLDQGFGNPSSPHWAGEGAAAALREARARVAALLGASPPEIVFTSGGSEASNWAIKSVALAAVARGRRKIVTSAVEHPATMVPCRYLERFGITTTVVPVDDEGLVDLDAMAEAIDETTALVSVMHANNEVGTLQPVAAIAELAHAAGALLHCDAAQSVGKIAVHPAELGADLLSLAGHKLYAPKGIGVLYVRPGLELEPLIHGGGHERGRRAGTENVLFAVALGAAAAVAVDAPCVDHLAAMRDRLHRGLAAHFGDRLLLNGHPAERLPNTLNLSFLGRRGHDVLARVPDLAASTGSACHSGEVSLSPVLVAMGKSEEACLGAVRFSTGRPTTAAEIDEAVEQLIRTS